MTKEYRYIDYKYMFLKYLIWNIGFHFFLLAHSGISRITAKYIASGSGNGTVEFQMPDGELIKGEYSILRGGSIGFGNIFSSVHGSTTSAYTSSPNISWKNNKK